MLRGGGDLEEESPLVLVGLVRLGARLGVVVRLEALVEDWLVDEEAMTNFLLFQCVLNLFGRDSAA